MRSSEQKSQGSGSSQLPSTHLLPAWMWRGMSRERTVLSIVCRADIGYIGFPLPSICCCCPATLGQVPFKAAQPKSLPFAIPSLWTSRMALPTLQSPEWRFGLTTGCLRQLLLATLQSFTCNFMKWLSLRKDGAKETGRRKRPYSCPCTVTSQHPTSLLCALLLQNMMNFPGTLLKVTPPTVR